MYEDKILICKDCGQEFTFTEGEQRFYEEKGFDREPQRCKNCRDKRKREKTNKRMFSVKCDGCGNDAQVPFEPKDGRPVYCSECFSKMKER